MLFCKMKETYMSKLALKYITLLVIAFVLLNLLSDLELSVCVAKRRNPQHVNPHDFTYVINPGWSICRGDAERPTLIVTVPSDPRNFNARQSVRNTWANPLYFDQIKIVFMLGLTTNETINEAVVRESQRHGDIVQEDFIDAYVNLTLKTLLTMKWTSEYCSNARFVLKIDDDIIMNTRKVYDYLNDRWLANETHNAFHCYINYMREPMRFETKWTMTKEDYPYDFYPTYCDGPAYLFSIDLAAKLFNASLYHKLLYLEDVSMGILAEKLNATFVNLTDLFFYNPYGVIDYAKKYPEWINEFLFYYTMNTYYPDHFYDVWNTLHNVLTG